MKSNKKINNVSVTVKYKFPIILVALLLIIGYVYLVGITIEQVNNDDKIRNEGLLTTGVVRDKDIHHNRKRDFYDIIYSYNVNGVTYYSKWIDVGRGKYDKLRIGDEISVIYLQDNPIVSKAKIDGQVFNNSLDLFLIIIMFPVVLTAIPIYFIIRVTMDYNMYKSIKRKKVHKGKVFSDTGFFIKVEKVNCDELIKK